jgi:ribosomal protein L37AE/L43A
VAPGDQRCPHCNNHVGVERHAELVYRCRVCGGPRVHLDSASGAFLSTEVAGALKHAQARRRVRVAWRFAAGATLAFSAVAAMVTLFVILLTWPGVLGLSLAGLLVLAPVLLGALAAARARRETLRIHGFLDDAWTRAARDVLESSGREFNAAGLGSALGLPEARAEALLALLNVDDHVASRVTDDGDVTYSARSPRVRVAADDEIHADDEHSPAARARNTV